MFARLRTDNRVRVPALTLAVLGLFILTIGVRFAYTFIDEVYFADPVINLLRGEGYKSFAWYVTTSTQTHVSTAPAYSFLLYVWLWLWGISQYAVRSLPALLAILAAAVLWRACVRHGWIQTGRAGAILISLVLLDYGTTFSYSCGRPDSLAFFLAAAILYLTTLGNRKIAALLIGLAGLALPFVQWSLVIYMFCLGAALLILFRKRALLPVVAVSAGMILGLCAERWLYRKLGLWDTWVATVQGEGSPNLLERILDKLTEDPFTTHRNKIPKDFTSVALVAGLAFAFYRDLYTRDAFLKRLRNAAGIIALFVCAGMYLVGKFPTYYGWMLCAPMAVILAIYFERFGLRQRGALVVAVSTAAVACLAGLPLQLGAALYDWRDRQPAAMTQWLQSKISKDDVVFCDYPFYYAAKLHARRVYTGFYIEPMTPEEAAQVTLVIWSTNTPYLATPKVDISNAREKGTWQPQKPSLFGNAMEYGFLSSPNYQCTVYDLRATATNATPPSPAPAQ